ncbi:tyrosine-protein phosphatase 10D-like [Ruditapes philippinarum]|uniref:tyrosine-protein phosphatase 10D-like n=1 Tax=Ruditapes philippinarum TaxID=129788 RepID=UPI00295B9B78|nr:tyrosine-protein phosphatase 10D-like [Ruditapes philippinarum]
MARMSTILIFLLVLTTSKSSASTKPTTTTTKTTTTTHSMVKMISSSTTTMTSPSTTSTASPSTATTITDIDDCINVTCQNGGTCEDGVNNHTCTCTAGYNGPDCEHNIDDCINVTCQNGGTCEDGVNNHTCTCTAGYNGPDCEHNIDDCINVTCQNGGTCEDGVNNHTCTCTAGYNGPDCEHNIDDCINVTCQNGGTCEDGVNNHTCTCTAGYNGPDCEHNIDDCINVTCQNGGTCEDGVNNHTCTCTAGYNGPDCEHNIDDCINVTCQHGGTCEDGVNNYTCQCAEGFNGTDCRNNIDDCKDVTCQHGGTCVDGVNNYTCKCTLGYDGRNCEHNIDDCINVTCQNGGTCKDGVNNHTCKCAEGYDGLDCGNNIDDCINVTCQNGGTCEDGVNSHMCYCTAGYDGEDCEHDIDECEDITCEHGGTCDDGTNAYTCNCIKGYNGEHCEIAPSIPEDLTITIYNDSIFETTVIVSWSMTNSSSVYITVKSPDGNYRNFSIEDKRPFKLIKNLKSGTRYYGCLYIRRYDAISDDCRTFNFTTRPANQIVLQINKLDETSIEVEWSVKNKNATENISIAISKAGKNANVTEDIISRNGLLTGLYSFDGLDAGTLYNISAYAVIGYLKSEKPTFVLNYTRPLATRIIEETKFDNRFKFTLDTSMYFNVVRINVSSANETNRILTRPVNETGCIEIYNLTAGTEYELNIVTIISTSTYDIESNNFTENITFTRPALPEHVDFPLYALHERSFTAKINPPMYGKYDDFCVHLIESNLDNCTLDDSLEVSFDDLEPGKRYEISINTRWKGFNSSTEKNLTGSIYTRPLSPQMVTFDKIEETYFMLDVDLKGNAPDNYSFIVTPNTMQNKTNITVGVNELPVNISELESGKLYSIEVHSIVEGISSEHVKRICSYTKPMKIDEKTIVGVPENTTSNKLYIKWEPPKGYRDSFLYNATCLCPNNHTYIFQNNNTNETHAVLLSLCPGTFCNITVVVKITNKECGNELLSSPSTEKISQETNETGPESVTNFGKHNLTHDSVLVTWDAPVVKNGIIRYYDALVQLNGRCIKKKEFMSNKTQLSDSEEDSRRNENGECEVVTEIYDIQKSSFFWDIQGLHPYRNYTVSIVAFTIERGDEYTESINTLEYTPGIPVNVSIKNVTSKTINFMWQPPIERNGEVRNYTVQYTYARYNCSKKGEDVMKTKYITEEPLNEIQLDGGDIYPFWTYKVSVKATNNAGTGNSSAEEIVTTLKSRPGQINKDTVTGAKEATLFNVTMAWDVPCDTNGQIQLYNICLYNKSRTEHEGEQWKYCKNVTSSDNLYHTFDIFPYRNYTFTVSAVNSVGEGDPSESVTIHAPIGPPEIPILLEVKAVTNDTISADWKTPTLFYGPVFYFVEAQDVKNRKKVFNTTTRTAYWTDEIINSTKIRVDEAYWEYNITVYASSGNEKLASVSKTIRTQESTPGKVSEMNIISEKEVTKPRTLTVLWKAPKEIDLNGKLTDYFIQYTNLDSEHPVSERTDTNSFSYIIKDIQPGNYRIEVFAATEVGNGSRVIQTETVNPGAPIKLNETVDDLVIKPSKKQPKDKERQIAVDLSLKNLLCNKRNGDPKRWGVIVAQDDEATDTPFTGNTTEFENKISTHYKSWFEVKDKDSISPYIATPTDWKGPCVKDQRKKRAIANSNEPEHYTFYVGVDGECQDEKGEKYCNGELQPGRSYRVKSFVCTSGGCTETEYSQPLTTAHQNTADPDLTIPIVAGVSSALLVIAIVFVVVFVLRRKQMMCFAKDDESLHTHMPGEGIHLDKIEHTKKNHFRQGPIKLTDFPDAVEKFHKDSDLIFADAYKLIKDKSPNNPMTAAEQQCCRPKNRYTNILPFDHSRVKLRPSDDIEGSDYINANYIPGYTSRREYIATQGPMQATFDDFWRMVWEQNVDTIVMLTKLMEKGRHKCDKYWPDLGEPVFYGDLVVSLQSESNLSDYTIKIFEIKMKEERKMVRHFSYLKWPDMGCPETPELLLEFVKAVKQYSNQEKNKSSTGPTIVHCSAGVGRTGTFIAVDYLLQHIRDHDEVDIFNLVLDMRNHRLNMVQTEDQYIYIHECLKAFITTDEEEEEDEEEEAVYVNTGFGADEENIYVNA